MHSEPFDVRSATFGQLIRRRRVEAGINIATASRLAHISPSLLSGIELGARPPASPPVVTRLLLAIGFKGSEIREMRDLAARERAYVVADERLPVAVQQLVQDLRVWGLNLDPRLLKALRATIREAVREGESQADYDSSVNLQPPSI